LTLTLDRGGVGREEDLAVRARDGFRAVEPGEDQRDGQGEGQQPQSIGDHGRSVTTSEEAEKPFVRDVLRNVPI
jgi:hypothetical protein